MKNKIVKCKSNIVDPFTGMKHKCDRNAKWLVWNEKTGLIDNPKCGLHSRSYTDDDKKVFSDNLGRIVNKKG